MSVISQLLLKKKVEHFVTDENIEVSFTIPVTNDGRSRRHSEQSLAPLTSLNGGFMVEEIEYTCNQFG